MLIEKEKVLDLMKNTIRSYWVYGDTPEKNTALSDMQYYAGLSVYKLLISVNHIQDQEDE